MKKERLGELIANAISHGIGILISIFALVFLILQANTQEEYIGVSIFGISLILLYTSSTLYHAFPHSMKRVFAVFKRLDHSAIYLLIAGTYTPFILILTPTTKGYILLISLWAIAIIGITLKSIWIKKYMPIHLIIYLLMGWSVLVVWPDVSPVIPSSALPFLFLGGISYTLGVIFYIKRFLYNHFVWHLFVLFGSIFHIISVYYII